MATNYQFRLIFVIPAANRAATNTWWTNNLDATGGANTFSIGLSASGNAPATHYWMNGSFTGGELKKIAQRLCTLAGLTIPPNWDTFTRAQAKQWFLDNRAAINAAISFWFRIFDNDGTWDNQEDVLNERGLFVIRPAP